MNVNPFAYFTEKLKSKADKTEINVLEDITSQCTVNSALVTSYGSFKVTRQGHLVQVFLGNVQFDHSGDLQGGIVTGLPQAVEQGNTTPTGDGSSKTAAILASGTAFWISKNATALDGNIGSNANKLWLSLWYYCV